MDILDHREAGARALDRIEFGLAGQLLAPLGLAYAAAVELRDRWNPPKPLPALPPSLAIGNLRVGGTGKTPIVADLGSRFAALGLRVAVLLRGYRSASGGDEPQWLRARGLQVELGVDRRRSFARAQAAGVALVLLDDALQSRVRATLSAAIVLDRDLPTLPRVLPAGPMREGKRALRRVDFVFVRCEAASWPQLDSLQPHSAAPYAFRLRPQSLQALVGSPTVPSAPLFLLSGLARPDSFERDALAFGLRPTLSLRLSDHASLGSSERELIADVVARRQLAAVVLPEKNAERFAEFLSGLGLSVHALRAAIQWREDPLPAIRQRLQL